MSAIDSRLERDALAQSPSTYDGMRVEVYDETNRMLFEAIVKTIDSRLLVLERASELYVSEIGEATPVTLRGFHSVKNIGVFMKGRLVRLAQVQDKAWMVEDLEITGTDSGRTFSRAAIRAKAWTRPESSPDTEDSWSECDVGNASSGGVRFHTAAAVGEGDRLWIRFKLRRGKEQPPLLCAVRRVSEQEDGSRWCGCEFVDITPEREDVLVRTIIALQNMQ